MKVSPENSYIYKLIVESADECIWLFDLVNMRYKYISPSSFLLRGLTVEEAMKENIKDSLTEESFVKISTNIKQRVHRFLNGDKSKNVLFNIDEVEQYCKDGTKKIIEVSTKLILNEQTSQVYVLGISRDLTERKKIELALMSEKDEIIKNLRKSEENLSRLTEELVRKNKHLGNIAFIDKLTGLNNRYFFEKKITEIIEESNRSNSSIALIVLDVDRFKGVNDTYGHHAGDKVLKKVANAGIELMSELSMFARWGGDEFVILAMQTDLKEGIAMAEKLRKSISAIEYLKLGRITVSIGVTERRKLESFESLFKRADAALYCAKDKGGDCVIAVD